MHEQRAAQPHTPGFTTRQTPRARHGGLCPAAQPASPGARAPPRGPGRRVRGARHTGCAGAEPHWDLASEGWTLPVCQEAMPGAAGQLWLLPAAWKHESGARGSAPFSFCGLAPPLGSPLPSSQVSKGLRTTPDLQPPSGSGTGLELVGGFWERAPAAGGAVTAWPGPPSGGGCVEPQTEAGNALTGRTRETGCLDIAVVHGLGLWLCVPHMADFQPRRKREQGSRREEGPAAARGLARRVLGPGQVLSRRDFLSLMSYKRPFCTVHSPRQVQPVGSENTPRYFALIYRGGTQSDGRMLQGRGPLTKPPLPHLRQPGSARFRTAVHSLPQRPDPPRPDRCPGHSGDSVRLSGD